MSPQILFLIPRVPINSFIIHNAGRGNASPCSYSTRLVQPDPNPVCSYSSGLGLRGRGSWSSFLGALNGLRQGSRGLWVVPAVSIPENADGDAEAETVAVAASSSQLFTSIQLVGMFGLWYLLNIYFNIFNKQVFTVFSSPL